MKILVVCLGNICRSPLGEAILQQKAAEAGLDWIVESAGTNHYHIGEPPHPLSQKVAALNGLDISRQRARRFTTDDFQKYDMVFAMAKDVRDDIINMVTRPIILNWNFFWKNFIRANKRMCLIPGTALNPDITKCIN
jgi:protein-tyrosine phosphatase